MFRMFIRLRNPKPGHDLYVMVLPSPGLEQDLADSSHDLTSQNRQELYNLH